jgi:mevalonate pyrophosphate decarboxylase
MLITSQRFSPGAVGSGQSADAFSADSAAGFEYQSALTCVMIFE